MNEKYRLIVIGGGPAGYVAAIKASQSGARVALVEEDAIGGTCLNRGCIPTKAYLKNAEIIENIQKAAGRGIRIKNPHIEIDMAATLRMKDRIVDQLTGGVKYLLKAGKVDVYSGRGIVQGAGSVLVDDTQLLSSENIIIAGGSGSSRIPIPGIESSLVLTSEELLSIADLPESLAVIGGGVIGVEMALIFMAFGVKVEIIEMENRLIPSMDRSLSDFIEKRLRKKGAVIHKGSGIQMIEENNNRLSLTLSSGSVINAEKALLSIGRVPNLSALPTHGKLDLKTEKGRLMVNDYLETSIPGIFAAGDITEKKMLAHAAFKMGEIAAENSLGAQKTIDLRYVPSVVYSLPELASVGLSEEEASRETSISTGFFPLSANGKALAAGESEGFVKIITGSRYGEVLGVHLAGPGASEIINEAAALMAMEVTSHEIADIIHGHPSVGEAFMEAAADSLGRCIHLPPKRLP